MKDVFFWVLALTAVASGVAMITRKKPVHSAIAFLGTLVSLAGLFLLLFAQFVAILQIVIYAGAILVLFLFVIMLLHAHSGEGTVEKIRFQRPLGIVLSLALLLGIGYLFLQLTLGEAPPPSAGMGSAESVGKTLFDHFILPSEVASVLLLAGIFGVVVLSKKEGPS